MHTYIFIINIYLYVEWFLWNLIMSWLTCLAQSNLSLFPSTRSCKQSIFCTDWWKAKPRWSDAWEDMFGGPQSQWLFISKIQQSMQWNPSGTASAQSRLERGRKLTDGRWRLRLWIIENTFGNAGFRAHNRPILADSPSTLRVSNFAIKIKDFMPSLVLALDAVVMPAASDQSLLASFYFMLPSLWTGHAVRLLTNKNHLNRFKIQTQNTPIAVLRAMWGSRLFIIFIICLRDDWTTRIIEESCSTVQQPPFR